MNPETHELNRLAHRGIGGVRVREGTVGVGLSGLAPQFKSLGRGKGGKKRVGRWGAIATQYEGGLERRLPESYRISEKRDVKNGRVYDGPRPSKSRGYQKRLEVNACFGSRVD